MTASLLMVRSGGRDETPEQRDAVYAYSFGAIDCIAQRQGVDLDTTLLLAMRFFERYFELSLDEVKAVAQRVIPDETTAATTPFILRAVRTGGEAALDWFGNRDQNAPLRLWDLLGHGSELDAN